MKKVVTFAAIVILILLIIGVPMNKVNELERSYQAKIDSLENVIKEKEEEIEILEESCQIKEAEISYWGQKYDMCKNQ